MKIRHIIVFTVLSALFTPLPVNLCFGENKLSLWSINPGTPFGDLTDRMVDEFSRKSPATPLESVHFTNNYYKFKLRAAFEKHQAPDLFHNWGENSIRAYVEAGRITALDTIEDQLKSIFLPISLEPVTFDGKLYGVPFSGLAGVFFWYRKDLFQQLDLKPPQTWQEFLAVGETLKQNAIIPIALANKNKWPGSFFYMYLVDRIGGPRLFHEAFTRTNQQTFLHPAFIKAGELTQELVKRDFFPQGFNRMADEPSNWNSLFISGQAGMYLMGTWFLSTLKDLPAEMQNNFDFFVFPLVEGGQGSARDLVGSPGQDYLSLSADSDYPDVAMSFLTDCIGSENYFTELAKQGFVPPVRNAMDYLTDPIAKKVARAFDDANHVQIYYDQIMPPTMAEAHKLLVHQLFELSLTPTQVAESHEDLIVGKKEVN